MSSDAARELAPEVKRALEIAQELIDAGIPVFAAPPCPSGQGLGVCPRPGHAGGAVEYDLPSHWQTTVPSGVWLDRWQPGWALAAVGGHAADFLDEDPRNGGTASIAELRAAGHMPTVFAVAGTPSGGWHYLISPTGERKVTGLLPGVDLQSGASDGRGRGFVWIAPTVRRSKADGIARAYVWAQEPDLDWLRDFAQDDSLDGLKLRVEAFRTRRVDTARGERALSSARARTFTRAEAENFWSGPLARLREASIGSIEDRANDLACTLSHFVPEMISEDEAFDVLASGLGETAYDPTHPASTWEADKFRAVVASERGRAPGDWYATLVPASQEEALAGTRVDSDEVSALLAEMLSPSVLAERAPPRYMIKGLLSYDSVTWLTGGPGSKKSFVVLDMAMHVASGRAWQERKVNAGIVVMIVGEGAGSIGKRIKAWEKRYGPMPDDAIRILPRPVQAGDLKAWAVLVRACERLRSVLDPALGMFVVVDTQARATVGLDENSAEEMGLYVRALDAIKDVTRGCVMSVHHTTKTGASTRGSGAQDGAQDSRLLMRSEKGTLDAKLFVDKQKDIEECDPIELRFEKVALGQDSDGEPLDSLVLLPAGAWDPARVDGSTLESARAQEESRVTPFAVRQEPEAWTHALTYRTAVNHRWLLQALYDTAEDHGLTKAEWRLVTEEKTGKLDNKTWSRAFQVVTGTSGRFSEVVTKVHGAQRWTVDRVAVADLL